MELKRAKLSKVLELGLAAGDYFDNFTVGISYDSGGTTATLNVIEGETLMDEVLEHFSWEFLYPWDPEWETEESNEDDQLMMFFYARWNDFISKQYEALQDWVVDLYSKHVDPLCTGWEKVSTTKSRNNYGYTDTVSRYQISNVATGYNKDITLSGSTGSLASRISVGSKTQAKMKTETESGRIGYSNTQLGKLNNLTLDTQNHTISVTATTGEDVTTSVQTGTFNRSAADDNPFTQKDTNKGSTASNFTNTDASQSEVSGSNYGDAYEERDGGRTYTGSETVTTDKDANTSNMLENMQYWIKHSIEGTLLDRFFHEETFYSEGCDCYG